MITNDIISIIAGVMFLSLVVYFFYKNYQVEKKYADKPSKH